MSIITLQIGQCGNQLGESFYNFLTKELIDSSPASQAICEETFFYKNSKANKLEARSILIDMEPKVINRCFMNKKVEDLWNYNKNMSFSKQEGSGNNWAFGYNIHGPGCREEVLKMFHKQLEQADFLDCVLFFQSLAGGTGSGVGSYFLEVIKEEYPEITIMNIGVIPHLNGEVIVQSYNSILSLNSLCNNSDGIILIENDMIQQICNNLLKIKRPNLDEMNNVIAHTLASFFYPAINMNSSYFSFLQNNLNISNTLNNLLTPNPSYKLLSLRPVPQMPDSYKDFSNETWQGLEKRLFQMLISNSSEANINWSMSAKSKGICKSLANLVIARGKENDKISCEMFTNPDIYTRKMTSSFEIIKDNHNFNHNERSLTLLSNCQAFLKPLNVLLDNANNMYNAKAYLYQYEKFNLADDDFLNALANISQVKYNYENLFF